MALAMNNPLLARFEDGQPALVAPRRVRAFQTDLNAAASAYAAMVQRSEAAGAARMDDDFWFSPDDWRAAYRPYVVRDSILHIPVKGVLLHDFGFALGTYATGYTYIAKALERGLADGNVLGIALVCNSPGGQVAGNFDLVDRIFAARGKKPIRAYAAEHAYSAAYSIASAAERVTVARMGAVGSIGVVSMHIDISKALDVEGVKLTLIYAGAHKVDGNPFQPLSDDAKAEWQKDIDETYGVFCATVARNRGLDETAVRATEARCFTATEATMNGLVDSVGALDDELAAFAVELTHPNEEDHMTTSTKPADAAGIDAARAEGRAEGERIGREAGVKEGGTAMQTRCKAILGSEESKGREDMAAHLAFDSDMSAEAAVALLAKAPNNEAAKPKGEQNRFDAAMNAAGNPKVGADASGDVTEQDEEAAEAAKVVAAYRGKRAA